MTGSRKQADEEAAGWLARLQSRTVSTDELEAFARWRRDPEHAAAYERAQALWDASATLSNDPDIQRALHGASEERSAFVSHPVTMLATVAAAVLLIIAVMSFRTSPDTRDRVFQTATGERSEVRLADGSSVQLDTDSQVDARLAIDERRIILARGQAFFRVAHDGARPFVVDAGDNITVTATGTAFDVRRLDQRVRVALVSGEVIVRRGDADLARMRPGQVVEVATGDGLVPTSRTMAETTSWRAGKLSFRAIPLEEAVNEMNRYTDAKLRIAATDDGDEPISGEFSVDDPQGFARAVDVLLGPGTVAR